MTAERRDSKPFSLAAVLVILFVPAMGAEAGELGDPAWFSLTPERGYGELTVSLHAPGLEVRGWSFELCVPRQSVHVLSYCWSDEVRALVGDTGDLPPVCTHEVPEDMPLSMEIELDPASPPITPGAEGLRLLTIEYAAHEESSLTLCEGASIVLAEGSYAPAPPAASTASRPRLTLSPEESQDWVTVSVTSAGLQGWSYCLCHDPEAARVVDFDRAAEIDALRGGFPPSFSKIELAQDPETGRAGVIQVIVVDFYAELFPPILEAGFPLLDVKYEVYEESTVEICEGLRGSGQPIATALTIDGRTFEPATTSATLLPRRYREKFTFRTEPPESGEIVTVMLYSEDLPIEGWSFALCHTEGAAEVIEVEPSPELEQLLGGEPPEFLYHEITAAHPFVAVRQDVLLGTETDPVALGPFPGGLPLLGIRYDVFEEDNVKFCDTVGELRFRNEVFHEGIAYEPATREGSLLVLGALDATFIRGDADLSRSADLTDAIFIFNALFLGSGPLPCLDAADVNDVGRVDISDPIFLLNFLFLGGPPPRPPFPEPGSDLSPHTSLGCERGL